RLAVPDREQTKVADHANDRDPLRLFVLEPAKALADYVAAVRPQPFREHAVDDRDGRSTLPLGVSEVAPGDQRHIEGLQEMRRHAEIRDVGLLALGERHAFWNDRATRSAA